MSSDGEIIEVQCLACDTIEHLHHSVVGLRKCVRCKNSLLVKTPSKGPATDPFQVRLWIDDDIRSASIKMRKRNWPKKVYVACPWHPMLVMLFGQADGRWIGGASVWEFLVKQEASIKRILTGVFGHDGVEGSETDVRVRVEDRLDKLPEMAFKTSELWRFGRLVAFRRKAWNKVTVPAGVELVGGGFQEQSKVARASWIESPADGTVLVYEIYANQHDYVEMLKRERGE